MSNYRSQYENYYGNIKKKAPIKTEVKEFALYSSERNRKSNRVNKIIDKLVKQSFGALFLLGFLMIIKYIPTQEARKVYTFSKELVNNKIDIKETITTMSFPIIDEYKQKLLEAIEL
jgi:hypothetical protein